MPKPLILVVEGEPALAYLLTRYLQREGFAVESCSLAGEAVQRLALGGVAMIVADFELADQNGALFLAEVHQKHPAVKRILLSGAPDSPAIGQALKQKDAEVLIQKPWDQSQFLAAVRGLLGQE